MPAPRRARGLAVLAGVALLLASLSAPPAHAEAWTLAVEAGNARQPLPGSARDVQFTPSDLAMSADGRTLLVADAYNGVVATITAAGAFRILARTHLRDADGGPSAIGVTPSGSVITTGSKGRYGGDWFFRLAKVSSAGAVSGVRTSLQGDQVLDLSVAVGPDGSVYYAGGTRTSGSSGDLHEEGPVLVHRRAPDGTTSVIAGNGRIGSPVAGDARASPFRHITDLEVTPAGNLLVVDRESDTVASVTPAGRLTIRKRAGLFRPTNVAVTPGGVLYVGDNPYGRGRVWRVTRTSASTVVRTGIAKITGLAADELGRLYIGTVAHRIHRRSAAGQISLFANSAGMPSLPPRTYAELWQPSELAVSSTGDRYVAYDRPGEGARIVRIGVDGGVSVVAGNGTTGHPVAGAATASPLGRITGLGLTSDGDLYAAIASADAVVRIRDGVLSVLPGSFPDAAGVGVDSHDDIYVGTYETQAAIVRVHDGTASPWVTLDGNRVSDITVGGTDTVYFTSGTIRRINPDLTTSAVTAAGHSYLVAHQVAAGGSGELYYGLGGRIWRVTAEGERTAIAGRVPVAGSFGGEPPLPGPALDSALASTSFGSSQPIAVAGPDVLVVDGVATGLDADALHPDGPVNLVRISPG